MSEYKRGDECIMRVTEINCGRVSWVCSGRLVRCCECVNWGSGESGYPSDYCPVVRRCTHPDDWCCWGCEKNEEER